MKIAFIHYHLKTGGVTIYVETSRSRAFSGLKPIGQLELPVKAVLFAGEARSLRLRSNGPRCKNLSADTVITDLDQLTEYMR